MHPKCCRHIHLHHTLTDTLPLLTHTHAYSTYQLIQYIQHICTHMYLLALPKIQQQKTKHVPHLKIQYYVAISI